MKNTLIAFTMIAALALCLVGCGASMSKEEMLSKAQVLDQNELIQANKDNPVAAEKKYEGNYYKLTGIVSRIYSNVVGGTDYCLISSDDNGLDFDDIEVVLSKDELAKLHTNQTVTVVGVMTMKGFGHPRLNDACLVE